MMIDLKLKEFFFDRQKLFGAIDAKRKQALSKGGAFIRRFARSSIRSRKRSSSPGQPPSSHTSGGASLKNILFTYDPASKSVIVGPVKISPTAHQRVYGPDGTLPETIEFGGNVRITKKRHGATQTRVVRYEPRPFMGPAVEDTVKKLPELWGEDVGVGS